jgi:PTS system mannose-specific IID component
MKAPARHVSKRSLAPVFFRSLFIQAAWNPRGMQNLGFASAMAPALADLYPDRQARIAAARRHLELFNCHPYAAAAIVGGAVRLEEEVASGTAAPQDVSSFKTSLASPFAALGDGFFWLALRPAAALLAALAQPYLGLWCVPLFLAVYDSVHLAVRGWLFAAGYQKGAAIIEILSRAHIPAATRGLKMTAAILAGALAARGVLLASEPHRPGNGVLVALVIVAGVLFLPRVGLAVALYAALALGLALGGGFL